MQNHAQTRLAEVADQQVQKLAASTRDVLRMTEADLIEAVEVYRCMLQQHATQMPELPVQFGWHECVWPEYLCMPI